MSCSFPESFQLSWYSLSGYVAFNLSQSKYLGNDQSNLSITKRVAAYAVRFFIAIPLFTVTAAVDITWAVVRASVIILLTPALCGICIGLCIADYNGNLVKNDLKNGLAIFYQVIRCIIIDVLASTLLPLTAFGYALQGKSPPSNRIENNLFDPKAWKSDPKNVVDSDIRMAIDYSKRYTFQRILFKLSTGNIPLFKGLLPYACRLANLGKDYYLKALLKKGVRPTDKTDLLDTLLAASINGKTSNYRSLSLLRAHEIQPDDERIWPLRSTMGLNSEASITEFAAVNGAIDALPELLKGGSTIDLPELFSFRIIVKYVLEQPLAPGRITSGVWNRSFTQLDAHLRNKTICLTTGLLRDKAVGEFFSCSENLYFQAAKVISSFAPEALEDFLPSSKDFDNILIKIRKIYFETLALLTRPEEEFRPRQIVIDYIMGEEIQLPPLPAAPVVVSA